MRRSGGELEHVAFAVAARLVAAGDGDVAPEDQRLRVEIVGVIGIVLPRVHLDAGDLLVAVAPQPGLELGRRRTARLHRFLPRAGASETSAAAGFPEDAS